MDITNKKLLAAVEGKHRDTVDDFLESLKSHGDILDYKVNDDGTVGVVLHPAIKKIKTDENP